MDAEGTNASNDRARRAETGFIFKFYSLLTSCKISFGLASVQSFCSVISYFDLNRGGIEANPSLCHGTNISTINYLLVRDI